MNAAITGSSSDGEIRTIRSPLRPRQVIFSVSALAIGALVSVVSYRAVVSQAPSFSGQVTPAHAYFLNFANSGLIQTVTVHPGQSVKAGQVLATQNRKVAQARLKADQAAIKADQATLAADKTLPVSPGSTPVSPAANLAAARSQLASDQAKLAADEQAVNQTEIFAPATGVIANTSGAAGDVAGPSGVRGYSGPAVESGAGQQSGGISLFDGASSSARGNGSTSAPGYQSLVTLYTMPLTVTAQVPEQNLPGVHLGQRATLRFMALNKTVTGTVSQIISAPAQVPSATYYDVVISIGAAKAPITPGMTVSVTLG
ncbi:MAG TPA: HlyD family efflux transporter periplasmic adaptor subunit [Streptosporangiaceae bacterium]|nr:HlyD family efflux transporter periplasmic adaptor subunit [Streptosporangiaceae bacterium]